MSYLAKCQTTKVILTIGFPKGSGYIQVDKQVTQFIQVILLLHECTSV